MVEKKTRLKHKHLELSAQIVDDCEEDSEMNTIPSRYL